MEYIDERWNALKAWLISSRNATEAELEKLTSDNTYNENCNTFEVLGAEYIVLSPVESDEKAAEEIKNSLWAFNADFVITHTEFWNEASGREVGEAIEALRDMQSRLCESCNAIVRALIVNIDEFIEDAINADGRGHFLSWYDGEEHESGGFYIYRTN